MRLTGRTFGALTFAVFLVVVVLGVVWGLQRSAEPGENEQAALQQQAKIKMDQASTAAVAAVPGTRTAKKPASPASRGARATQGSGRPPPRPDGGDAWHGFGGRRGRRAVGVGALLATLAV